MLLTHDSRARLTFFQLPLHHYLNNNHPIIQPPFNNQLTSYFHAFRLLFLIFRTYELFPRYLLLGGQYS